MSKQIVSQVEQEVKCGIEGCHEPIFRLDLCLDHFVEEETARWDDQAAERETCLEGVGYVFSDSVWEEVLA